MRLAPLIAGLLLSAAAAAVAQPAGKVNRIAIVSPLAGPPEQPTVRAFRQGLRELGYLEGKNLILDVRYANGRSENFPGLFAEMARLKVDVIVTGSGPGILAAKKATSSIPIVFAGVLDPVAAGIVENLAKPGGNITGTTFAAGGSDIAGKWVEFLAAAAPGISRIGVLTNLADPQSALLLQQIHAAARMRAIHVQEFDARSERALNGALAALGSSGVQGMIVTNSPLFGAQRTQLIAFATARRLPTMYFFNLFPDSGGLMSYGGRLEDSYRRAAVLVDKILKGAKPGELPVEQPTRLELVVNRKAAKALGLDLPQSLLMRADRVID